MPFRSVKFRTSERFNEVHLFLNFLSNSEPSNPREPVPLEINVMKGLFCVHLYAAFEKSISDAIETVLALISSQNIKNNHLTAPILSVVLQNKIKSLKDSGYSKIFIKSSDIFIDAASSNIIPINETVFANQLQNVKINIIDEIVKTIGMNPINLSAHTRITIDEIVDKRNAVAHGRDSAASVGQRYRMPALREKMKIISAAANEIIDAIEDYYGIKKYIKPNARRHYSR